MIEESLKNVNRQVEEAYTKVTESIKSVGDLTSGDSRVINEELEALKTRLDEAWRKKLKRRLSDYLLTSQTFTRFLMQLIGEDNDANLSQENVREENKRKVEIVIIELVDALKDLDEELLSLNDAKSSTDSTKCEEVMESPCKNQNFGNTKLCRKDENAGTKNMYTICEKIQTFALKNFQMIRTRNMSKTLNQISRIVAKHLAIGSNFAMFDKEVQRLFEKSSLEISSKLKPEIFPIRNEFETVESMLQGIQENLLTGEGE